MCRITFRSYVSELTVISEVELHDKHRVQALSQHFEMLTFSSRVCGNKTRHFCRDIWKCPALFSETKPDVSDETWGHFLPGVAHSILILLPQRS